MKLRVLGVFVVAALVLAGCGGVDPDSPLGKRKAIFQQMLDAKENLGGMLRGRMPFDGQAFAIGAVKLDELSSQPWQHYPEVREKESDARDEVWEKQARFNELARALEVTTSALLAASQVQPLKPSEVAPAFQQVEDACSLCHKEFRSY
ncbi:cytochrome c [Pseudomonas sp. ABC1]|uniref:c-type cytochrome n=1 Tax=Pseudomonas sp. ABC1 TaxID=2748080 RepID=UPI0015C2DE27|nr:cytochrome c [Pseudomonas sp. ABC1]QLF94233.1 cytochrome c [Pseudomonas sp. ABC1]